MDTNDLIPEFPEFPPAVKEVIGEDALRTMHLNVGNYLREIAFRKDINHQQIRRKVSDTMAGILSEKHKPAWLPLKDCFLIYNQKKGIYEDVETYLNCALSKICPDFGASDREEVLTKLKLNFLVLDEVFENKNAHVLGVKNGVLDLQTFEMRPHSPQNCLLSILPIEYNPSATCPEFMKFLNSIVAPDDVKLLEEWLGYCLQGDYRYQKALMLQGGGSNGKSTFVGILTALLGQDNVSSVSLQALSNSRFASAELYQKKANIYADLPKEALKASDMFKSMTGGDWITVERKFKNPFRFRNSAKLIFSANTLPETEDMSDAFYRRWSIVIFPNQFVGDMVDATLEDRLKTPEELSGILNLALAGLARLNERRRFADSGNIDYVRLLYLRLSDSIAAFVQEEMEETQSEIPIPKQEWLALYQGYCRKMKTPPQTDKKFFMRVPQLVRVVDTRPGGDDRRPAWIGVRPKPDMEPKKPTPGQNTLQNEPENGQGGQ